MQVRQIPLEDFFKNPEKARYQISPDGKHFSFMAPYEKRMNLFVQEIGKDSAIRLTSEKDRDIAGYFWKNPNRIVFLKDTGGDENFKLYGVDIDGSDLKCFTDFPKVRTEIIDDLYEFPDELIIGLNKRNPEVFDPFRLNIVTGEMKQLAENPGNIQGWILDHDGKLRAAIAIVDGVNTQLLYREKESDPFKPVLTTSFKESLTPLMFTFDNKNVYATSNLGRDKSAVVIFDIANGKELEVLYENKDYDVSDVTWSRTKKVLVCANYESWKQERYFFDQEGKQIFDNIQKHLGNFSFNITSLTKNEDKFMVRAYSDRSLGGYFVYDRAADQLQKVADIAPWLREDELAEMLPVEYTARDSTKIQGYLTLPVGYTMENAKDLPVIVNPHGGPWARDGWYFNPEIQFLANRGFAILQMNFRGSTGYGKAFWEKSFKQWGLTMQDDITDGTQWLIDKGIANPKKIALYGGSYGGYATLQGLVREPDLYAAGVDYVGVSNLFTFMKTIPPYWKPMLDMMYEMVGNPQSDSAQFVSTSPALNSEKIKTPLFVAQGKNDPRVNIEESNQIVDALKKRGIVVEYMVKDNEGHGFHNEENRFDFYRAMEKFLEKHLK
ncbi:MAG: S9 family peptidase [Bacteroidales bacterium]|nr:S9 family peptidase [Bacteroidales bacterium]HNW72142.1 S9 family peptidase [Bacteroidales bacterium]HPS49183.1 S9 family peptidase [Bacteroidales bacterium]